jgi:vacuolar-type H+-ATPase subunit H
MENEIVETTMTGIELVSLIASIASLILAIGAIWLSIAFFKMSNEASKATTEAAKGIDSSIQRLENLFDKLYSDTFSMMKDTVTDMRKHIWSGGDSGDNGDEVKNDILEEANRKADEKMSDIKQAMDKKLDDILLQQRASDGEVVGIRNEIEKLLDNAIETSRMIESEARDETVRQHILTELLKSNHMGKSVLEAQDIVTTLSGHITAEKIITEVRRMEKDGLVALGNKRLTPDTEIKLLARKKK